MLLSFGAIKSAIAIGHGKCVVDPSCSLSGESETSVGGTTIAMRNGYPGPHNGIALLVDYGDWELTSSATPNYGAVFALPGTSYTTDSDCTIYYGYKKIHTYPKFINPINDDTCS